MMEEGRRSFFICLVIKKHLMARRQKMEKRRELDSAIKAFVTAAYSLLEKSVEIACDARVIYYERCKEGSLDGNNNGWVLELRSILVAASVGSYGAYLDFHRRRVKILTESRADLIAFETNPNKDKSSAYPVLLEDEGITIPACFECASIAESYKKVVAVGTNCTPPRFIQGLIFSMKKIDDIRKTWVWLGHLSIRRALLQTHNALHAFGKRFSQCPLPSSLFDDTPTLSLSLKRSLLHLTHLATPL
ncbi:hypothetical protein K2173_017031 [Erythroxylum novogranatense]|uniref:Hcy-binding domain-containing protein n=1 Tax=Erythroxylum novogranatense TaxID=1862640 RepID=A0AAV8U9F8_9ROSI|nr:hypothetical protein K2173_017031 [Erythroxylum novogranatense]